MSSDKEIIETIASGNKDKAIAYLYKTHFPKIKRMVINKGGAAEDAKDAFQEAIIYFYTDIINKKFASKETNIEAYLTLVARNKWIDKVRRDKRLEFKDDFGQNTAYEQPNINHNLLSVFSSDNGAVIEKMLRSVGERCYALLQLSIFNKFTMKQMAEKLNFSNEDSAKTQHYKCKAKMIELYSSNMYVKSLLTNQA